MAEGTGRWNGSHLGDRRALGRVGVLALLTVGAAAGCSDQPTVPTRQDPIEISAPWVEASASDAGMDALVLRGTADAAADIDRLRSLLVVRHGKLVLERYYHGAHREAAADVRSVTKSLIGALAGLALETGALTDIGQPVTEVLEARDVPFRPEHAAITVEHLLTMSSGIEWRESGADGYNEWITDHDRVGYLLEREVEDEPGSTFEYNSGAVHLLSLAVAEATGQSLPDFADARLFRPLGIEERQWEQLGTEGVNGASGLDLRPRDLARIGQLYLQGGRSGARQIIPGEWVDASLRPVWPTVGRIPDVGPVSYGRLFWIDVERDAAFAWGHGGQFLYIAPRLDLVVVVTTEWRGVSGDVGNEWLQRRALSLIVDGVLPTVR